MIDLCVFYLYESYFLSDITTKKWIFRKMASFLSFAARRHLSTTVARMVGWNVDNTQVFSFCNDENLDRHANMSIRRGFFFNFFFKKSSFWIDSWVFRQPLHDAWPYLGSIPRILIETPAFTLNDYKISFKKGLVHFFYQFFEHNPCVACTRTQWQYQKSMVSRNIISHAYH